MLPVVVAAACSLGAALPGVASADTLVQEGSLLRYEGDAGSDSVAIETKGDLITFRDRTSGPVAVEGSGTCLPNGSVAVCALAGDRDVQVFLGDGTNRIESSANDPRLRSIEFRGGSGVDLFDGSEAAERYFGLGGSDEFDPLKGNDRIEGGTGVDRVHYPRRFAELDISLDGNANDGSAGETANVRSDVEELVGGNGADTLTGNGDGQGLDGGAGSDKVVGGGGDDVLEGGDGTDRLQAGTGADLLGGGDDGDSLDGGDGPDVVAGGDGDDGLDGGAGADVLRGDAGRDFATYASRGTPVHVDFEGDADDGAAGEGDTVEPSVEDAGGGTGNDELVGDSGANALHGGEGDDRLDAREGDDTVVGGFGTDRLELGSGTDRAFADSATERTAGEERRAAAGRDREALEENRTATDDAPDSIFARDGEVDALDCGTVVGALETDAGDKTTRCDLPPEQPQPQPQPRPGEAGGPLPGESLPGAGGPAERQRARLVITSRARLTAKGIAPVKVKCVSPAEKCVGVLRFSLTTKAGPKIVGGAVYSVKAGGKKVLRAKLTKRARGLARRRAGVVLTATAKDPRGTDAVTTVRPIRILPARR